MLCIFFFATFDLDFGFLAFKGFLEPEGDEALVFLLVLALTKVVGFLELDL
jgi:hypothetical protein